MRLAKVVVVLVVLSFSVSACYTYRPVRQVSEDVGVVQYSAPAVAQVVTIDWSQLIHEDVPTAVQKVADYAESSTRGMEAAQTTFDVLLHVLQATRELHAEYPPTSESDSVEYGPIPYRQKHQSLSVRWDTLLRMSVGPATQTLWQIAHSRESEQMTWNERLQQQAEPLVPSKIEAFVNLFVQYVQLKSM